VKVPALVVLAKSWKDDYSSRANDFAFCSITTHPCKERKDGPPATRLKVADPNSLA
jgi:hypothetical protein